MRRAEHGTVSIFVLGLCLMLFALGGISLDLWRAFSARRALASAADAAALAGAAAIDDGAYRDRGVVRLVPAAAEERARTSLARQLDRASLRTARILADEHSVSVTLAGSLELTLARLLVTGGDLSIEVHATSMPVLRGP
jgi:Flp pilus assembly protein TadG